VKNGDRAGEGKLLSIPALSEELVDFEEVFCDLLKGKIRDKREKKRRTYPGGGVSPEQGGVNSLPPEEKSGMREKRVLFTNSLGSKAVWVDPPRKKVI